MDSFRVECKIIETTNSAYNYEPKAVITTFDHFGNHDISDNIVGFDEGVVTVTVSSSNPELISMNYQNIEFMKMKIMGNQIKNDNIFINKLTFDMLGTVNTKMIEDLRLIASSQKTEPSYLPPSTTGKQGYQQTQISKTKTK